MHDRTELRDEVAIASGLCMVALADGPGADHIPAFSAASHLVEVAEQSLHLFVREAREKGMTWAEIGDALGISRQAAHKRFGGQVPQKVTREAGAPPPELVELALELMAEAADGRFERLDALASAHVRQLLGAGGMERAFAPVETIYGTLVRREEPTVRMIGRVVIVQALEHRTIRPTRAEVVLSPGSVLLGFQYFEVDAA